MIRVVNAVEVVEVIRMARVGFLLFGLEGDPFH